MRAIVIEPGRPPEVRDLAGDLPSLQAAVGGYIGALPLLPGVACYVDEEARIRRDTPPKERLRNLALYGPGPAPPR